MERRAGAQRTCLKSVRGIHTPGTEAAYTMSTYAKQSTGMFAETVDFGHSWKELLHWIIELFLAMSTEPRSQNHDLQFKKKKKYLVYIFMFAVRPSPKDMHQELTFIYQYFL